MNLHTSQPTEPDPGVYAAARQGAVGGSRALVLRYVVVGVLSLAGTTALVRLLGTRDWAIVAQGYFLVVFLEQALGANLLGGLVRRLGVDAQDVEAAARLVLYAALTILVVCLLLAVPAAEAFRRWEWGACLAAVGVGGAVFSLRSLPVALLERDLEYSVIAVAEVVDQVVFYALAIPAAALGAGVPGVLLALAVRSIPGAVFVHRRRPTGLLGRRLIEQIRDLLRFARPSLASAVLVLLDGLIPLALLGGAHERTLSFILTTSTIVGYAATLQVVAQRVGFASLARLQDDPQGFRFAAGRAATVSTVAIVTVAVPLAGLGTIWMPLLLGLDWEAATWVLALLGAMIVLQSPVNLATAMLYAQDRPRRVLALRGVQTGVYLIVAVGLVGPHPLVGVAIGALVGRFAAALFATASVRGSVSRATALWLLAVPLAGAAAVLGATALAVSSGLLATGAVAMAMVAWLAVNRGTVVALRRAATARAVSVPR